MNKHIDIYIYILNFFLIEIVYLMYMSNYYPSAEAPQQKPPRRAPPPDALGCARAAPT